MKKAPEILENKKHHTKSSKPSNPLPKLDTFSEKSKRSNVKRNSSNWIDRLHVTKEEKEIIVEKYRELQEEVEMKEFTGKPLINKKSHALDSNQIIKIEQRTEIINKRRIKELREQKEKKEEEDTI